jgi:hypothetical protein
MANTIKLNNYFLSLTAIDSDWLWSTQWPEMESGIRLYSIQFVPGAANDRCIITEATITGAEIYDSDECTDNSPRVKLMGGVRCRPCLDFNYTDAVYSAGSKVLLILSDY